MNLPQIYWLSDSAGLILIPTPGEPSLLSFAYRHGENIQGAAAVASEMILMNGSSGANVLQLNGPAAEQALAQLKLGMPLFVPTPAK